MVQCVRCCSARQCWAAIIRSPFCWCKCAQCEENHGKLVTGIQCSSNDCSCTKTKHTCLDFKKLPIALACPDVENLSSRHHLKWPSGICRYGIAPPRADSFVVIHCCRPLPKPTHRRSTHGHGAGHVHPQRCHPAAR
jgi:hypothetical protein